MSEIENTTIAEEDEISLIDLFSVLIKHRFMIIAGTIAVGVIGIAYLFLLPILMKSTDKHAVTIEYTYQIDSLPLALEQELGFSDQKQKVIVSLASYNMNRLTLLADEVKKYNPFGAELDEMTPYAYNRYIQTLSKEKKYTVTISPMQTELIVTLTVPENNISQASLMVNDIVSNTVTEIENYIFPKIDAIEKATNDSLSFVDSGDSSTSTQKLKDTQVQIKNFKTTYEAFLVESGEPFILLEPLGRLKKLIIIVFAAFFIFVFIAFLLNAVENIKKDPEASEKIKTAWDGGKIARKK
jgi:hypothetical protein